MQASRRSFTFGAMALALSGCGGGATRFASSNAAGRASTLPTAPNPGWSAWIDGFKGRALARGFSPGVVDMAFRGAGFIPGVVERDRNQTEFKRSLEDYLAIAASDERVSKGRSYFAQQRGTLERVEAQYGVPANIVCAVWGLESYYGERRGTIPVMSALSTLAYDGRRGAFFEAQLFSALKILRDGDTVPENMTGSWAGAMGHTQFMPESYERFAVDFTGDGRRDIWEDDPADSLASTANYLARSGWQRGQKWGGEQGAPGAAGRPLQPQAGGPVFLVGPNFSVIKRYNNSDSYALGVGHLADRIAGGGPIRGSFPPDANGLRKDDRIALQQRLTAAGYDTDGADGVIGPNTRKAITAFQQARGLAVTGEPSVALLNQL